MNHELKELMQLNHMTAISGDLNKTSNDGFIDMVSHVDLSGKTMVELGCHRGVSTKIFSMFCQHITTVDIWGLGRNRNIKRYKNGLSNTWDEVEGAAIERLSGCDNVTMIKEKTSIACDQISDGSVDFVYIDACHKYQAVKEDIELWMPKIKEGGKIGGHDYASGTSGVIRAVTELSVELGLPINVFRDSSWVIDL
jgi:predicted O-methyltransferase YrrM